MSSPEIAHNKIRPFILTVTRTGAQLNAQATGQVVVAQLTFNQSAAGVIESVTLNQAGQQIRGKKLTKK